VRKVVSLRELESIRKEARNRGLTVGLVTGCFDILHVGHVELFRFAKNYSDIVIVGLDSDKTISINKGERRPVNRLAHRAEVLAELESVDYVFGIPGNFDYQSPEADRVHQRILRLIKPDLVITRVKADKYWKAKKRRIESIGGTFLAYRASRSISSTLIGRKIASEF
jgi:rfaE bifunctional protein nucleotidyltransferase chain/domain